MKIDTTVFVTLLTSLIAPTLVANRGTVYGVCSTRCQSNQRLIIPNKKAAGHFLLGFCGTLTTLMAQTVATTFLGVSILLVYPYYNFFKRLKLSRALGLNNTSYGINTFDFLLGVWTALYFYSLKTKTSVKKCCKCKYVLMFGSIAVGIIVLMSALLLRAKIQTIKECKKIDVAILHY